MVTSAGADVVKRGKRSLSEEIRFGPYRLDGPTAQLFHGEEALPLPPKSFAVLCYLLEHRERLVTKEELLDAVWGHRFVSEGVLKNAIGTLREALRDEPKAPRYIETRSRLGYRFIAEVRTDPAPAPRFPAASPLASAPSSSPPLVGRAEPLLRLQGYLEKAVRGEPQVVFVTGEPGIGKTALIAAFRHDAGVLSASGHCVEQYGQGEPYLPVLEALNQLCREAQGEPLLSLLRQYAPTWLAQLPWFLSEGDRGSLQREVLGATKERMLRELGELLERWTAACPFLLVIEDLHWSDYATLDLISYLARRKSPARWLLLGSYRPVDVIVSKHPLQAVKQELQSHQQCMELPLELLTEADLGAYLAARFGRHEFPAGLAAMMHQRTDGNPLFGVNVVNDLLAQGAVVNEHGSWILRADVEAVAVGVPESIRQMIERQVDRLPLEEQRLLEGASVAGCEFSAAEAAAALGDDLAPIEERCECLARNGHFLCARGLAECPDGTIAARYGFLHSLYQNALYDRLGAAQCRRFHQRIGEWAEGAYGDQVGEIAAGLAVHFEQGRDPERAVRYLKQAGDNAIRQCANQEAITLLTKGLEILKTLPETLERAQQELSLQMSLAAAFLMNQGYTAPEVKHAYARAHALCEQIGESPYLFPALLGLFRFELTRGEPQGARALAEPLLRLAQAQPDALLLPAAHLALGATLFHLGEPAAARAHVEQGLRAYDRHQQEALILQYGQDMGIMCLYYARLALQVLGYPDQALARSQEALALGEALSHPFILAHELAISAFFYQLRRDGRTVQARAEAALALVNDHGFSPLWRAYGTLARGWALTEQGQAEEGIVSMHHALDVFQTVGFHLYRPYRLGLLTEALEKAGRAQEGRALLAEALATGCRTGERWYDAELYRLQGELTLEGLESGAPSPEAEAEAEACFEQALDIARRQGAKLFELRAMMSLGRLRMRQGRQAEARSELAEVYGGFTEGFDTQDLQEARALLETLA